MTDAQVLKRIKKRIVIVEYQMANSHSKKAMRRYRFTLKALRSCLKRRKCKQCKKAFQPRRADHRFCKNTCAATFWYYTKKEKKDA